MIRKIFLVLTLSCASALAQSSADNSVIGFYLTPGQTSGSFTCKANSIGPCFVPYGSSVPVTASITPSGNQLVNIDQTTQGTTNGVVTKTGSVSNVTLQAGSAVAGKVGIDQTTPGTTNAVSTNPGSRVVVTLDVKTVTTGGTAVTALSTGHRTAGGFLQNPVGATINLCINEIGIATGTTSSGDTTCIQPGQSYNLSPSLNAVSVISSDSSHPFSGYGLQ